MCRVQLLIVVGSCELLGLGILGWRLGVHSRVRGSVWGHMGWRWKRQSSILNVVRTFSQYIGNSTRLDLLLVLVSENNLRGLEVTLILFCLISVQFIVSGLFFAIAFDLASSKVVPVAGLGRLFID